MRKRHRPLFSWLPTGSLLICSLVMLGSCTRREPTLALADLTPGERAYCLRILDLERAKSVALVHRDTGTVLLDSLASAWGDSVKPETLAGLSDDPSRSVALGEFLLRLLAAEQDSLKAAPGRSRLGRPLPDLNRPGRELPAPS